MKALLALQTTSFIVFLVSAFEFRRSTLEVRRSLASVGQYEWIQAFWPSTKLLKLHEATFGPSELRRKNQAILMTMAVSGAVLLVSEGIQRLMQSR